MIDQDPTNRYNMQHRVSVLWSERQEDIASLRQQVSSAKEENERVRQANLDVMMHFEDMKATKEKLEADLDRALARVCMQHDYLESLVSICTKQAKLLDSTVDPLVDLTNSFLRRGDIDSGPGKAWVLRKQAEAVEAAAKETAKDAVVTNSAWGRGWIDGRETAARHMVDYATRLRKQADQQESTNESD